jgi:hypothetical protein
VRQQDAVDDEELDFLLVMNGRAAAISRSRWKIIRKGVAGRLEMSIAEVLEKLDYLYSVVLPEPETILDYYQRNYLETKANLEA